MLRWTTRSKTKAARRPGPSAAEEAALPVKAGPKPAAVEPLTPAVVPPGGTAPPTDLPPAGMAPRPRFRNSALIILAVLAIIAFLYFARPVLLPFVLACMLATTLRPVTRWMSNFGIPAPVGAAFVLCVLLAVMGLGIMHLSRPAMEWMKEAPEHVSELRVRARNLISAIPRIGQAAAAVSDLSATEEKKPGSKPVPVEVKDNSSTTSFFSWTGLFLEATAETLILLYLLLASGDLPLQKLVRVMPTWQDKKRAVEISHEIQRNISDYLFSVTLINLVLGIAVSIGLHWLGVPNATMWGIIVALFNFIPYFGPFAGILLLAIVGLLTFDTLGKGLLPGAWYLLLHLLEANFITPILLGRRFLLNPVIIFISLMFWTWLWGIPGALLSVPILVSFKVICEHTPSLGAITELLTQGMDAKAAAPRPTT